MSYTSQNNIYNKVADMSHSKDKQFGLKEGDLLAWDRYLKSQWPQSRKIFEGKSHSWRLARLKAWGDVTGWGLHSSLPVPSLSEEQNLNLTFEGKDLYSVPNKQPLVEYSKMTEDEYQNIQSIKELIKALEKDVKNFDPMRTAFYTDRVLNEKQFINGLHSFLKDYEKAIRESSSEPSESEFGFFNPEVKFNKNRNNKLRRVNQALSLWRKKPFAYTFDNFNFNAPGRSYRIPKMDKCNSFVYDAVRGDGEEGPFGPGIGFFGRKICSALALRTGNCPDYSKGIYSPQFPRMGEILAFSDLGGDKTMLE